MIDFSLFGSKARQLAGLDISSSSVKLVELSGGDKEGYKIERYAIEPLPRDAVVDGNIANLDVVSEAVRRALRRFGAGVKNVAMALPASSVITKKIILPDGLREQEMELQVESEANQYIPFALDEVNLDFQVIGPAPSGAGEVEVLIAASRKDKVEDRVAAAQAAGLKAVVVDVESLAIESAFELVSRQFAKGADDKVVALIDIGASVMNVTVLRGGQQVYSREQAFGGFQLTQDIARQYGMSFEEAETAKRSGALPDDYARDLMRPFMDSLALEVSRALQFFFTSTQFNQVDYLVLAGGCAVMPGLAEVVAGRTQVETIIANPFAGMTLSSKVRPKNLLADAPSLMVACGLALRRFDA
ncbi:pilus assembly protein PilM [Azoarcus olearius]|uniref:Probable type 4 fimbrial biogenesis protein n=1 Tax=Azoarcus sp. (strain BH72) TaxID=418699 RepID=A1KBR0_AZOSB|nr:pilus assembly protein PilM [Azoarcus olearius]CAL96266.1 probable type 4 fimbrial biogenesis protein [Azoarcus olearius]